MTETVPQRSTTGRVVRDGGFCLTGHPRQACYGAGGDRPMKEFRGG